MSYAEELSIKVTAQDEASARLKDVKKQLRDLEKQQAEAAKKLYDTGSKEAAADVDRLAKSIKNLRDEQKRTAAEAARLNREIARLSTTRLQRTGDWIVKHQRDIQRAGLVAGAAMAFLAKTSVDAASDLAESTSKTEQVFKGQSERIIKWSEGSAAAMGMSQQAALEAVGTYGNLFQAFGLGESQASAMSSALVQLASDLASFNNTSTEAALDALRSGISGEAEPLKRYGVALTDARMREVALAKGIYDGKGALDARQKALAAYELILKDTVLAQGDYARTADGAANAQRSASAEWANAQAALGEGLLPLLTQGSKVVATMARGVSGLPGPVRDGALAVGALGVAAMIATPRLVALNTALASRGGLMGFAKSGWKVAAGITVVAAALAAAQTQVAGSVGVYDEQVGTAMRNIVQPGWYGSVNNFLGGIRKTILPFWTTDLEESRSAISKFDVQLTDLVTSGRADEAGRMFEDLARDASTWGASSDEVLAQLPAYAAAMNSYGEATGDVADEQYRLAASSNVLGAAATGLAKSLAWADRLLARRAAQRSYRQALADFRTSPTAEAGDAVSQAALGVAATFTNPEKAARFTKDAYKEIEQAVKGSSLPGDIQRQITTPLRGAYQQALDLLDTVKALNLMGTPAGLRVTGNQGAQSVLRRAAGGYVAGPGTGTSDSIPAMLSNGEYVIRAAAVDRIGLRALDRLNYADRGPLPVNVSAAPITLTGPAGRDAPLVGSMTVVANTPLDMQRELAHLDRQRQRQQRSRTGTARR